MEEGRMEEEASALLASMEEEAEDLRASFEEGSEQASELSRARLRGMAASRVLQLASTCLPSVGLLLLLLAVPSRDALCAIFMHFSSEGSWEGGDFAGGAAAQSLRTPPLTSSNAEPCLPAPRSAPPRLPASSPFGAFLSSAAAS